MKKVRSLSLTASTLSSHLSAVRRTASLSPVLTPSAEEEGSQLSPLPENGVSPGVISVSSFTDQSDQLGGEVLDEEGLEEVEGMSDLPKPVTPMKPAVPLPKRTDTNNR